YWLGQVVPRDRVIRPGRCPEDGGRGVLGALGGRPPPGREVDHGAVVVAVVAEEPPEPLGAAERPVRDDQDAGPDACPAGGAGERSRIRQRVPATGAGRTRQVALDIEEGGARNVARQVLAVAPPWVVERPPTVDEDVLHLSTLGKERSSAAGTPLQPTLDRVTDHHNVIFRRL